MWGAGGRQNRKIRLYKGTLDPKLSIFWIYLDLLKSNPTLFSPQVRRITGRKCRCGRPGGVSGCTRADHLHDLVRDRCAHCIYNSGRHWDEAELPAAQPKEDLMAPLYPRCTYGYRRILKSGTTYKPTCKKCAVGKKNGRTRRHSRRRRRREEDGVAESSQQQGTAAGTSANTLRRCSGGIISPRPNHPGRAPRGRTWNGREYQPDHPNAPQNVARRTQPGACRGISRLQADWQTDFPWMHCERDTALMAATGGRCVTTPSATDCEECVGCHQCSRTYCKHCRSRTGNTFRADIGCRTFKRDELARHERTIFHPNKVGSSSVQPMLSNEAQRAKQTRIRTILAEFLAAVEKSRVPCLGSCCRARPGPCPGQPQSG